MKNPCFIILRWRTYEVISHCTITAIILNNVKFKNHNYDELVDEVKLLSSAWRLSIVTRSINLE